MLALFQYDRRVGAVPTLIRVPIATPNPKIRVTESNPVPTRTGQADQLQQQQQRSHRLSRTVVMDVMEEVIVCFSATTLSLLLRRVAVVESRGRRRGECGDMLPHLRRHARARLRELCGWSVLEEECGRIVNVMREKHDSVWHVVVYGGNGASRCERLSRTFATNVFHQMMPFSVMVLSGGKHFDILIDFTSSSASSDVSENLTSRVTLVG